MSSDSARGLIVVLAMFVATVPFALDMYLPALPSIAADLGADAGAAAHSVSAFLFGLALGQFFFGPLSDRYGRRAILTVSLAIFTLASAACALSQSVGALVAFRVVEALGAGAAAVVVNALVRDLFEERDSASVMSIVFMVMLAAPLFAPIIGGYLLAAADWRLIFWVLCAYGVVCVVVSRCYLPARMGGSPGRAFTAMELLRAYGSVLVHREAMGYNLASGFAGAALFAFITGSSFFYIDVYGVAPTTFGYLFAANVIALLVLANANRTLVRKHGLRKLILAGCAAQVVATGVLTLGVDGRLSARRRRRVHRRRDRQHGSDRRQRHDGHARLLSRDDRHDRRRERHQPLPLRCARRNRRRPHARCPRPRDGRRHARLRPRGPPLPPPHDPQIKLGAGHRYIIFQIASN